MGTTTNFIQKSTDGTPVSNIEDANAREATLNAGIKLLDTGAGGKTELDFESATATGESRIRMEKRGARAQRIAVEISAGAGGVDGAEMLFGTETGTGTDTYTNRMTIAVAGVSFTQYNGNQSVTGNLTAVDCFATSDERLKKNVKPKAFDRKKLLKLAALVSTFNWKDDNKEDFGVIAQEVEKIGYPELVYTDEDGIKSVNYAKISLLVLQMVASLA